MDDILYLEVDEEIPSVIEKLKQQPTDDVVFVVPSGAALLQSVVNVKLLKRTAEKAKKQLALVTTDPVARHVATQVGIPVFVSVKDRRTIEAPPRRRPSQDESELDLRPTPRSAAGVAVHHYTQEESAESTPKGRPATELGFASHAVPTSGVAVRAVRTDATPPERRGRRLVVALVLLALLGGLGALLFLYPRVAVELTVATEPYETNLTVVVDSSKQFVGQEDPGVVAGEHIDTIAEATAEVPATGTKDMGTKAQGTATLENRLGQAVKLSNGTPASTGGQSFKLLSDVTIPAATASIDASGAVVVTPGRAEVNLEAANAGETGNIKRGTTLSLQGVGSTVQEKVSTTAKADFTGGTSRQVTVVSDEDLAKARAAAEEQAKQKSQEQTKSMLAEKRLLDSASRTTVTSEQANGSTGDERPTVSLTLVVKYEAIVFDDAAFRTTLSAQLERAVDPGRMVVFGADDKITSQVSSVDWSAGTLTIQSTVNTRIASHLDEATIVALLQGRSISDAQAQLKRQPTIAQAALTVRPSWLPRLPTRVQSYDVRFSQAAPRE